MSKQKKFKRSKLQNFKAVKTQKCLIRQNAQNTIFLISQHANDISKVKTQKKIKRSKRKKNKRSKRRKVRI